MDNYPDKEAGQAVTESILGSERSSVSKSTISPSDTVSLEQISLLAQGIVSQHVEKLCKKYCYSNRKQYQCTLDDGWGQGDSAAALCEWGNASYAWMLEYLLHENRISKIENNTSTQSVLKYYTKIIHSIPFKEQYKDWRFQRRIQVPMYIKAIDNDARLIFWWCIDGDSSANMAQRLKRREKDVVKIVRRIKQELQKRNSMRLLDPPTLVSLTKASSDTDDIVEMEFTDTHGSPEQQAIQRQARDAFNHLTWQEQYILQAMVIDGLSATSVLDALLKQDLSIVEDINAKDLNIQHIYYFLRKSVSKLQDNYDGGMNENDGQ